MDILANYSLAVPLYGLYLSYTLLGGLKRKRLSLRRLFLMPFLLALAVVNLYDGLHSMADQLDILLISVIALSKGVYLGQQKQVAEIDGAYYISHDYAYILKWLIFFAAKFALTGALEYITHTEIALWHTIFYLLLYFTTRSLTILALHPAALARQPEDD